MAKCPKCLTRKGKRFCAVLDKDICSQCCAQHRLQTIRCPEDCPHLQGEHYQLSRRKHRAASLGKKFLDNLGELFPNEHSREFAFLLQADVFWWMRENGVLANGSCAAAYEELKGRLSPVFVPPRSPQVLARFLHDLVTSSKRYSGKLDKTLNEERRRRVLATLAKHVASHGGEDSTTYFDELGGYFGQLDFEADLDYSPAEELEQKRPSGSPSGYRETSSGLIVPGR